jgi:ammonia channel protein AmtB
VGAVAGALFVVMFTLTQNKWKIDDVLGVWPLHGVCGAWGGLAAGIFGLKSFQSPRVIQLEMCLLPMQRPTKYEQLS